MRTARTTPSPNTPARWSSITSGLEWCGPCVEEMPGLVALQKAFAGKDVAIPVAFGFGKGVTRETTLAKFRELVGKELPYYYDGEIEVNAQAKSAAAAVDHHLRQVGQGGRPAGLSCEMGRPGRHCAGPGDPRRSELTEANCLKPLHFAARRRGRDTPTLVGRPGDSASIGVRCVTDRNCPDAKEIWT